MQFDHPYLTQQIIAYIGNKRKLIPLIYSAIESTGLLSSKGVKFLDLFAGSGVVSRFAKYLGFEVHTNDWEFYSNVINNGMIKTSQKDIKKIFGSEENYINLLNKINSLPAPKDEEQYISKYYAPKEFDADKADFRTERLFYTRENALAIDKIRNYIEKEFSDQIEKKNVLLSNLLYEAATHNNTSGVFKACHKGFGGHNKDALKRIMYPIELHPNILVDSDEKCYVYQENAATLVTKLKGVDIAYLDPPYNQHQYGSNYHLLNTIAMWDKIPAPLDLNEKGELKHKAAIRADWVNTRSPYCYKESAVYAFSHLINNLDARYILISYSTDGIISFDDMKNICAKKGKVSVVTNEYTKYRGGKQSSTRKNENIEFIICIDTSKESDEKGLEAIEKLFLQKKLSLILRENINQKRVAENEKIVLEQNDLKLKYRDDKYFCIKLLSSFKIKEYDDFSDLEYGDLEKIYTMLSSIICQTKMEEIDCILNMNYCPFQLYRTLPSLLRKLAHKKNRDNFYLYLIKIKSWLLDNSEASLKISDKISAVEEIAEKRFKN